MTALTPAVTPMNIQQQGAENFPTPAGWVDAVHLSANTNQKYDVAAMITAAAIKGKNVFLVFSADGPFWANFQNGAAVIPTGQTTDGSASEFAPNQRYIDTVRGVNQVNFIAAAITNISIQVYEV